jgi:hypothetical protein
VKTPIVGVVIFALAFRAHHKALHRGVSAIVGQRFDDREAWTAIRAIGERVTKATIIGIENFAQTIAAGGDVGQDERRFLAALFALANFEAPVINRVEKGILETL